MTAKSRKGKTTSTSKIPVLAPYIRGFVEQWRCVGPLLRQIRQEELRAFVYDKGWRIIDPLLDLAVRHGSPRTTSGLVEQQRLFMKARR